MAKVVPLFKKQPNSMIEAAESILEKAKAGEIVSFIFAAKCNCGDVATAYGDADFGTRAELLGHVQIDLAYHTVAVNINRILEGL